jgi:hypothetical protein
MNGNDSESSKGTTSLQVWGAATHAPGTMGREPRPAKEGAPP